MIQNRLKGQPPGSSNTESAHERCVPQWLAQRRPPFGAAGEIADRRIAGALWKRLAPPANLPEDRRSARPRNSTGCDGCENARHNAREPAVDP